MNLKLFCAAAFTMLAFSSVEAQQWRPIAASRCQPCVRTVCNQPARMFRANRFQRSRSIQCANNYAPGCISSTCVPPVVWAPQNSGFATNCPPQFAGQVVPGSVVYSWETSRQSQPTANDCGCNRPGMASQQGKMLTDKDGKTLTAAAVSTCPDDLLWVNNGNFYYSAIECPSGVKADVILVFSAKVLTDCNGMGCNSDPIQPVGVIELLTGTIITPETIEKIKSKIAAGEVLIERSPVPTPAD